MATQLAHLLGMMAILVAYWIPNLWKRWEYYEVTASVIRYPLNIPYYYLIFHCSLAVQPRVDGATLRAVLG
ncbi:MAG: hypothetical protein ACE5FG_01180 [Myxococcota bacterium]